MPHKAYKEININNAQIYNINFFKVKFHNVNISNFVYRSLHFVVHQIK